jgi:myb proto-oncogene protein
VFIL